MNAFWMPLIDSRMTPKTHSEIAVMDQNSIAKFNLDGSPQSVVIFLGKFHSELKIHSRSPL
jgi:hypothetical protein